MPHALNPKSLAKDEALFNSRCNEADKGILVGYEARFDRIARITQAYFHTSIVLISVVSNDKHWFKSALGLNAHLTEAGLSLCAQALSKGGLIYIPDTQLDPQLKHHLMVMEPPNIRFFASFPVESPEGLPIGTLSLLDSRPKTLSALHTQTLKDLAALINSEVARSQYLIQGVQRLSSEFKVQQLLDDTDWVFYSCKASGYFDMTCVNNNIVKQSGYQPQHFIENNNLWMDSIHPRDLELVKQCFQRVVKEGSSQVNYRIIDKNGKIRWVLDCQTLTWDLQGLPLEIIGLRIETPNPCKAFQHPA